MFSPCALQSLCFETEFLCMGGCCVCVPLIILYVYISHGHMKKHKEHLHCLCVCAHWQKDSSLHFFKASLISVELGLWTEKRSKKREEGEPKG